jgi:hypothetical protein
MSLFDHNPLKPISDGIKWFSERSDADVRNVKDATQQLLSHLSLSLVRLAEVTKGVSKLSDKDFRNGFGDVCHFFREFYYNPEPFETVRIHCTDLKREVGLIQFKLSRVLRTDLGKWNEAETALQLALLEDASYQQEYRQNFETLNTRLKEIEALLKGGKKADALKAYKTLTKGLTSDLDYLNEHIKKARDADTRFREIVG